MRGNGVRHEGLSLGLSAALNPLARMTLDASDCIEYPEKSRLAALGHISRVKVPEPSFPASLGKADHAEPLGHG